ncbi:MAG: hypothetical protein PUB73_06205 [Bacteroidales bacterium]|nr:hypothetical protein [Bacteroidales bacterium]
MKQKITELSHNDLVNILSTALYGCDYLSASYDHDFYNNLNDSQKQGNCFEDALADVLLNGGAITIIDYYAEGDVNGKKGKLIDDDNAEYTLTLQDFLDGCSTREGHRYAVELLVEEDGDYYTANNLLQIIMFGEVIYG